MDATAKRQLRHQIAAETLGGKRSLMGWIAFGFVGAIAVMGMAYENTTVPKDIEARQLFEHLFSADGENRLHDATGTASDRRGFARSGDVLCRTHVENVGRYSGRRDRAYDYDCVATVTNRYDCVRYVPFYVEDSSIGKIARPVDAPAARQILADFKLLGPATVC